MSRSFKIWVEVNGTGRKTEPTFGSNDTLKLEVFVGSSKNSVHLADIHIRQHTLETNQFFIDVNNTPIAGININHPSESKCGPMDFINYAVEDKK